MVFDFGVLYFDIEKWVKVFVKRVFDKGIECKGIGVVFWNFDVYGFGLVL